MAHIMELEAVLTDSQWIKVEDHLDARRVLLGAVIRADYKGDAEGKDWKSLLKDMSQKNASLMMKLPLSDITLEAELLLARCELFRYKQNAQEMMEKILAMRKTFTYRAHVQQNNNLIYIPDVDLQFTVKLDENYTPTGVQRVTSVRLDPRIKLATIEYP